MLKRNSSNASKYNRWRELQAAQNPARRQYQRFNRLRLAFYGCVVLGLGLSAYLLWALGMGSADSAESWSPRSAVSPREHRQEETVVPPRAPPSHGAVVAGVGLDFLKDDLQIGRPEHKMCDVALFLVEKAQSLQALSPALQRGHVLSVKEDLGEDACCEACARQTFCQGFRFQQGACTLLDFSRGSGDLRQEQHQLRSVGITEALDDTSQKDAEQSEREDLVDPFDEDLAEEQGDESDTADVEIKKSQQQQQEQQQDEQESEGTETVNLLSELGSDNDESADVDGAASMEQVESAAKEGGEAETEMEADASPSDDDDDGDFADLLGDLAGFELPKLESAGGGSSAGGLEDFLNVNLGDQSDGDDSELLAELEAQVKDRFNPEKDDEAAKAAAAKAAAEATTEQQLDQSLNQGLARTNLKSIIPLGDYNRLTARDKIYGKHSGFFLRYRPLREIMATASDLADFHKDVSFVTIGTSSDKKNPIPIKSLRVGNGRRGKHLFVVGTMRGCEWTSSMAILHTAMVIKGRGETTKALLDAVQLHFLMVANPDGFQYSHHRSPSNARSWCKNRRVAISGSHGVDLEHNWGLDGVSWGFGKRNKDGAKLDTFQGPANFSEPETRALRDYMQHYATGRGRVALIHVKCCNAVITPPQVYKAIENPVPVNLVAERLAKQVEQTDGSKYSVQQRESSFHAKNHGQMIDWAHNEAMIDHAYMVEVKGTGLATRTDHAKISVEPFQTLLRELETATVFVAQRLLALPIQGAAVDAPYKPSRGVLASPDASPHTTGGGSGKRRRKKKAAG